MKKSRFSESQIVGTRKEEDSGVKVMKATQGKANPKVVNEILISELSK